VFKPLSDKLTRIQVRLHRGNKSIVSTQWIKDAKCTNQALPDALPL
jgi:hypothetical protein